MNGSSSDFSVHSENGTEYLRKTNCLRQEKGEISSQAFLCVLLLLFSSRAIFVKRVRINEIEWQVSEPLGQKPLVVIERQRFYDCWAIDRCCASAADVLGSLRRWMRVAQQPKRLLRKAELLQSAICLPASLFFTSNYFISQVYDGFLTIF